nr:MAG TPA: hypothetical protein [Caudoviricetes sp.]
MVVPLSCCKLGLIRAGCQRLPLTLIRIPY